MMINIPEKSFEIELKEAFEKMPPKKNKNPDNKKKASPSLYHVAHIFVTSKILVVTSVTIYKAILSELKNRGIIVYNSDTDTWQGVNYRND